MKLLVLGFFAVSAVTLVGTAPSGAVPASGSSIAASLGGISNVEQVACYSKRTGIVSHPGRCRIVCTDGVCRKVTW
jgi:hypothetical protein